jgi:hypothetical protein
LSDTVTCRLPSKTAAATLKITRFAAVSGSVIRRENSGGVKTRSTVSAGATP